MGLLSCFIKRKEKKILGEGRGQKYKPHKNNNMKIINHIRIKIFPSFQEDTALKLVAGSKKVEDYDIPGAEMDWFSKQMKVIQ